MKTNKKEVLVDYLKELSGWVSNINASREKMKAALLKDRAILHPDRNKHGTLQGVLKAHAEDMTALTSKQRDFSSGAVIFGFRHEPLDNSVSVTALLRKSDGQYYNVVSNTTRPLAEHILRECLAVITISTMKESYAMVASLAWSAYEEMEDAECEEVRPKAPWELPPCKGDDHVEQLPPSLEKMLSPTQTGRLPSMITNESGEPQEDTTNPTNSVKNSEDSPMIKNDTLGSVKEEMTTLMKSAAQLAAGQAALAIVRAFVLNAIPKKMGLLARLTGKKKAIHEFLNSAIGSFVVAATAHTFFTIVMPNHKKIHTVTRAALNASMAELALKVPYQRLADSLAEQLLNNSATKELFSDVGAKANDNSKTE